nr:uncharacterized protein LOC128695525 [Cherax quadricarinatus]
MNYVIMVRFIWSSAGRWATGPYAGMLEGTYSVKMTLRHPIPSYVMLQAFRTQVYVTYAGQRRTCRLCGSYDHIAAQCGKRRGNLQLPQQQQSEEVEEGEGREQSYANPSRQRSSWSDEVEKAQENALEDAIQRGESPSLDINKVFEETLPTMGEEDVAASLAKALDVLLDESIVNRVEDPGAILGSVEHHGEATDGSIESSVSHGMTVNVAEVEVHHDSTKEIPMQVEGRTRKRTATPSDSDDVLTPAQRPGKKSWADVQRKGNSESTKQEFIKVVPKKGGRDRGVVKCISEKSIPRTKGKSH